MVVAHDFMNSKRTDDVQILQNITFDSMLLSSNTLDGLKKSGFVKPSPIQLHGIPLGKCGFDLMLEAKSGTGKTAVFAVIALERLDLEKGLQVVILAPTREIAAQICDVLKQIGCQLNGLSVEVVMGGLPIQDDIEKFKGNNVHIVVGSPGRVKHLIRNGHMDLSAARLLVLDEADKLMEKSFFVDIESIFLALPQQKQVILSSATYPEECKQFIERFVQDMQHICPNSDCVLLGVVQKLVCVKYNSNTVIQTQNRFRELLRIIKIMQFKQCLIFCNYQVRVREVYKMLTKEKWPAEQLHGAQEQTKRLDALKTLQEYKCRILISTDLAARGIDASNVDLVINFEPPFEWQTYLHRIGRAGRFGSYGMAITLLSEGAEQKKFMTLLSAVNMSSNLSLLWKDDIDNVNGDQSDLTDTDHLHTNGFKDCDYNELWKTICHYEKPINKFEDIESFHELFNSFEKVDNNATTGIESFSDLYGSFQNNHTQDTMECQYKCIKWPHLSPKQYLLGIKDNLNMPEKSNDFITNVCTYSTNECENTCEMKSDNKLSNAIKKCNIKRKSITGDNSTLVNQQRLIGNKTNYLSNNCAHDNKFPVGNISVNECDDKESGHSNSDSDIIKTKRNTTYMAQAKANSNNNRGSIPCDNFNRHTLIRNQPSTFETSNVCYPTEECYSENYYANWYKQLKFRARHIELAVYINELRKLS